MTKFAIYVNAKFGSLFFWPLLQCLATIISTGAANISEVFSEIHVKLPSHSSPNSLAVIH